MLVQYDCVGHMVRSPLATHRPRTERTPAFLREIERLTRVHVSTRGVGVVPCARLVIRGPARLCHSLSTSATPVAARAARLKRGSVAASWLSRGAPHVVEVRLFQFLHSLAQPSHRARMQPCSARVGARVYARLRQLAVQHGYLPAIATPAAAASEAARVRLSWGKLLAEPRGPDTPRVVRVQGPFLSSHFQSSHKSVPAARQ